MVSSDNTQGNIIFMYLETHPWTHTHVTAIKEKQAMDLKDSKGVRGTWEGWGMVRAGIKDGKTISTVIFL